jgi:hypothetical protein
MMTSALTEMRTFWAACRGPAQEWRALVTAGLLLASAVGCTRARDEARRFPSPDGAFTLVVSPNRDKAAGSRYLCLNVQIVEEGGLVRYDELTGASARLNWDASWRSPRRVALDSSDIGMLVWQRGADGRWRSVPCVASDAFRPSQHRGCDSTS